MRTIQLQIPEPCHENWNAMTPVEKGRFCSSCEKTVIDLSGKSDAQIIQFFKRKPEHVCGHLHADQLNRDLVAEPKRIPWLRYLFTITIPTWFFVQRAEAQGRVRPVIESRDTTGKTPLEKSETEVLVLGGLISAPVKIFEGQVSDEQGAPIAFASVTVKGRSQGTMTDSAGRFRLSWSGGGRPTLIFSSVGYSTVERKLTSDSTSVTLARAGELLEGAVVVVRTTKRKKNKKENQSTSPACEPSSLRVYPNPVASAASFQIDGSKLPSGEYELALLGISGNLVRQRIVVIQAKAAILTEPATGLTPGTYVVRLVHKKTHTAYSEKIIVQ